jgi:hypothetical protein
MSNSLSGGSDLFGLEPSTARMNDVTRIRDRDLNPDNFDTIGGEFFARSLPPVRQPQQAVRAALAGLKGKMGIANEFCQHHDPPKTGLPPKEDIPTPATHCSHAPSAQQNILDF